MGEETASGGGGSVVRRDGCSRLAHATACHTLVVHTHIWLVSCAFTSFKICINLVLKIYIYILCCPCYLTTFGQPMAGWGRVVARGKEREEKEQSGS